MNTPWKAIFALTPHLVNGTRASVHDFTRAFVERQTDSRIEGIEHLSASPRFVIAANHYQHRSMWIAHPASLITQTIRAHYNLDDPPMHWIVTGNWPGPASAGNFLLRRVANALSCFAVPFLGTDPKAAAQSLLRLLRAAASLNRPIGLFPEGAAGVAERIGPALPGIDRLLRQLARRGMHVQPVRISEAPGLTIRFAPPVSTDDLLTATDPAALVMAAIRLG